MPWVAPIVAWVGANAGAITAVAGAATAAASVHSSMQQAKALKAQSKQASIAAKAAGDQPGVVPLADENSGAVRLRLLQTQRSAKARQGAASTLVSGALGDSRAPSVAAPLVLGKAA